MSNESSIIIEKEENILSPNNQKTLVIHKLTLEDENLEEITEKINKNLFRATNYFSPDNPVVVGKRIKIDEMKQIFSPRKSETKKKAKPGIKKTLTSVNTSMRSDLNKPSNNHLSNKDLMNIKFEKISHQQLKGLFDSFKDNSIKQSFSINNTKEENLPLNLSRSLTEQTKNLNIRLNSEKKISNLSKFISKKVNKKEKDLLMNRIDVYKLKKEIYNDIENSKPINDRYGQYKWVMSLRRPEHFKGERESYINIGNDNNPFWALVKEKFPIERSITLKPGYDMNSKDYLDFKKNQFLPHSSSNLIKKVEGVDTLSINGENLYNLEYRREVNNGTKNKILHKIFMDNGRMILDKDINEEFGNETIYKSYNFTKNDDDDDDKIESKIFKSHMFSSGNVSNSKFNDGNVSTYNQKVYGNYNLDNPLLENSYKS
jgi:hypothetical protein